MLNQALWAGVIAVRELSLPYRLLNLAAASHLQALLQTCIVHYSKHALFLSRFSQSCRIPKSIQSAGFALSLPSLWLRNPSSMKNTRMLNQLPQTITTPMYGAKLVATMSLLLFCPMENMARPRLLLWRETCYAASPMCASD